MTPGSCSKTHRLAERAAVIAQAHHQALVGTRGLQLPSGLQRLAAALVLATQLAVLAKASAGCFAAVQRLTDWQRELQWSHKLTVRLSL